MTEPLIVVTSAADEVLGSLPRFRAGAAAPLPRLYANPAHQPAPELGDAKAEGNEAGEDRPLVIRVDPNKHTLQGIALQYNVTTDQLRRANGLTSDRLNSHFSLIIPRGEPATAAPHVLGREPVDASQWVMREDSEARRRNALEAVFVSTSRSRAGANEARYYLGQHAYKLEPALEHFERDARWERANTKSFFSLW